LFFSRYAAMSNRRQEIYDRIRSSSKDEVVLEEMVRLGFWPRQGTVPTDPANEIRRRGEIERELAALRTEQSRLANLDALRKEALKRRLEASKAKQKETKARRERERLERAALWKEAKKTDVSFLGTEVSRGLSNTETREAQLTAQGLPVLRTAMEIATAMGITVPELRFLAYDRRTSSVSHYARFTLPKKTGGERLISAPMPRLKRAQHWILEHVLNKVALHDAAHGFRATRSIVTNAGPHVGAPTLVNVDLKDFFPTLLLPRIKGVFRSLGYGEVASTIFSLLCSEPNVTEVVLDEKKHFVSDGVRRLPQGAPTSPAITNIVCRRLDRRLAAAAANHGFVYTRYADDLTFSSPDATVTTAKIFGVLRWVVQSEGFVVHPDKTRVLRKGARREVTGVVVNEKLSVNRETLRKFRAFLFQLDKDGPVGKHWGAAPDVFASALGFAAYVKMVDPKRGAPLLVEARAIARKYGWKGQKRPSVQTPKEQTTSAAFAPDPAAPTERATPAQPTPKKKWWKLF
jgi:RNA-directed DNA polymerase